MTGTDPTALTKARSLLVILLATCEQTLLALDAAANALDTDVAEDLRRMIGRTRDEITELDAKIQTLRGSSSES